MSLKERIEAANAEALRRITAADPVLVDVAPAAEVIPGMRDRLVLHSGPPIEWARMCGAQRGAVIGMCLFEGWAKDREDAERRISAGEISLEPNHHHATVGPMAGTITRNMWVWVVENKAFGNRAYCRQVESFQQFGDYSKDALSLLEKWRDEWGPALRAAVRKMGGVPLKPLISRALLMGDEMHNRVVASSSIFTNAVAPALVQSDLPKSQVISTLYYAGNHPFLFLGLSMAAGEGHRRPGPRGGSQQRGHGHGQERDRVRHPGERAGRGVVHRTRASRERALPPRFQGRGRRTGYGRFRNHGNCGVGRLRHRWGAGHPQLHGRDRRGGAGLQSRDAEHLRGRSPDYLMPALDFEGTAVGIDIRKVVQTNIVPVIDTAIAHKEPGHGIIGGGIVRPPLECFTKALKRFAEKYKA